MNSNSYPTVKGHTTPHKNGVMRVVPEKIQTNRAVHVFCVGFEVLRNCLNIGANSSTVRYVERARSSNA